MLINLIIEHASQEAEAGQFEEVANILKVLVCLIAVIK